MKRVCVFTCLVLSANVALAQDPAPASSGANLSRELWQMNDANVIPGGAVDLRFTFGWESENYPANGGDSSDDFFFTPSLTWGLGDNVEMFVDVPIWLGDGGDRGDLEWGNADTNLGFTWQFADGAGSGPSMALQSTLRIPTGDDSRGVDVELRLIVTHQYSSGIRSHVNVFGKSVNKHRTSFSWNRQWNGHMGEKLRGEHSGVVTDSRHFQWGLVAGLDGPLCGDGAVRWVLDYMHRSSFNYGQGDLNMLEAGWEWTIDDVQKLGMSWQFDLNGVNEAPNVAAMIGYARALTN